MIRPKREPSAEIRNAAAGMAEVFTALMDEGFTEAQALTIIGQMVRSNPPEAQP